MSTLTDYRGLSVVTPEPSADGGKAINDNFKALSTPLETTDPGPSDDRDSYFSSGSRWYNTSTNIEWICTDATPSSAVWQIMTTASQWTTDGADVYYAGGNVGIGGVPSGVALDVVGTARASASYNTSVGSVSAPTYTFNSNTGTGLYCAASEVLGFSSGGGLGATLN